MLYEFGKDALAKINDFIERLKLVEKVSEKNKTHVDHIQEDIRILKGGLRLHEKIQEHQGLKFVELESRIKSLERENEGLKSDKKILKKENDGARISAGIAKKKLELISKGSPSQKPKTH
jgi:peptidoglycan hydrolase CwlO-like protein